MSTHAPQAIGRPEAGEHHPYFNKYIDLVAEPDPIAALAAQMEETAGVLGRVAEADAGFRYQPGKWSIREVLGHLMDVERVMTYRALRIARADQTPLAGFDENSYVPAGAFDRRTLADLLDEWRTVRNATLAMFRGFGGETWTRRGVMAENPISVRALLHIVIGHERHHLAVLRTRYGLKG